MGKMTEMTAETEWTNLCNAQGWSDASQVIHLEGFLRQEGLFERFAAYAAIAAAEENGEILADPRLEPLESLGYDIQEDSDQPGMWLWMAPSDASESSVESAAAALEGAWADAAGQAADILGLSPHAWNVLSLEEQIKKVIEALTAD